MSDLEPLITCQVAQVAVPAMNADHEDEVRLLAAAADAARGFAGGTVSRDAVAEAMDALYDHTRAHTAREEEAMRAGGDPDLTSHRVEHERALAALDGAERRFRDDGDAEALRAFLVGRHLAWLTDHIGTADRAAARFCQEWGG